MTGSVKETKLATCKVDTIGQAYNAQKHSTDHTTPDHCFFADAGWCLWWGLRPIVFDSLLASTFPNQPTHHKSSGLTHQCSSLSPPHLLPTPGDLEMLYLSPAIQDHIPVHEQGQAKLGCSVSNWAGGCLLQLVSSTV